MSFGRFRDDSNSGKNQSSSDALKGDTASSLGAGRKEVYIGKGSKIVGNLHFSGPTELDGQIDGEVIAEDRLTIGESAVVNAKLSGTEVVIKGNVTGDVVATSRLILKKPAKVIGSLISPLLSIEEGVVFEGKIAMASDGKKVQSPIVAEAKGHATTGGLKSSEVASGAAK